MYTDPSQMEPLLPSGAPDLEDLARDVVSNSAALGGLLHPVTQRTVADFLRIINSYYSNLIEGHRTHPVDIELAMRQDYSSDPAKRNLQLESLSHINCQKQIEERLLDTPLLDIADTEFLTWLHRLFYEHLPPEMRQIRDQQTGLVLEVEPGSVRTREVVVGRHVGPAAEHVLRFLQRFASAYAPEKHHGVTPIIAAAASHHRLMWIHPFLDGNGRTTRLYTDACLYRLRLQGYGLWNVSRGLARQRGEYMGALSLADAPRRHDYDGRGNLSNEGLVDFCRFFLRTCLDQISYMQKLLRIDGLLERLDGYVAMRQARLIPPPTVARQTLKPQAVSMLQETLVHGQVSRGDIIRASGLAERTGRLLLSQLLDEGLVVADTPKGPVRMGFPIHAAGYLFPDLFPGQPVE